VVTDAEVVDRRRAELADPTGRVRRNVYQRSRGLELAAAAKAVAAAERIAAEHAAAALKRIVAEHGVRLCAVVVGAFRGAPLESILASHALAHAAEGRLYQQALLEGAEACGLDAVAVSKKSIWEEGGDELRRRIDNLRKELGPPWAEDQKLAALAAWIALRRPRSPAGAARSRRD
jgi:hypothetical protein